MPGLKLRFWFIYVPGLLLHLFIYMPGLKLRLFMCRVLSYVCLFYVSSHNLRMFICVSGFKLHLFIYVSGLKLRLFA